MRKLHQLKNKSTNSDLQEVSKIDNSFLNVNLWDQNAENWIKLTFQGKDLYRDYICTPGFFSILPDIANLKGLDIACGDGHFTRLLASKKAQMTAIDLSKNFVDHAKNQEKKESLNINYQLANALNLPFADSTFDFATCFFALIDIHDYTQAIKEAYRVLKPGGFFQFVIPHPCTWVPDLTWVYDEKNRKKAAICGGYFSSTEQLNEWTFEGLDFDKMKSEGKTFKSIHYRRTLTQWIDTLVKAKFIIEKFEEPKCESKEAIENFPLLEGGNIIPIFLIIRCKKI